MALSVHLVLAFCVLARGESRPSEYASVSELTGWADGAAVWHDPPMGWEACGKVTNVFGVAVCVSPAAWKRNPDLCDHVAHVFYQLLDNDADGAVDDATVHQQMVHGAYALWVPNTENEQLFPRPPIGHHQMTGLFEAVPNTCDMPSNRGASNTDRSTWAAAMDTASLSCSERRDATTEEVLHLITEAAAVVYSSRWGSTFASEAGQAIQAANGNCGWGFSNNWINPGGNGCTGQYAYIDPTCDERCIVIEGIYWASITFLGGVYTSDRARAISGEWLMAIPDATMPMVPGLGPNAISLQAGSPALYALVSDTTSEMNAWLPAIMPDGQYMGLGCPLGCMPARRRLLFGATPGGGSGAACPSGCDPAS